MHTHSTSNTYIAIRLVSTQQTFKKTLSGVGLGFQCVQVTESQQCLDLSGKIDSLSVLPVQEDVLLSSDKAQVENR